LEQVVRGDVWGGGWSDHVDAWVFSRRPNTLVLRFQDMVHCYRQTLELLANFLSIPLLRKTNVDFGELHPVAPLFFRKGSNVSNIAELVDKI
jgi:hypothetical protein